MTDENQSNPPPPPPPSWPYPPAMTVVEANSNNGYAMISLIAGILVPFTCGVSALLSVPLGLIAIVQISEAKKRGVRERGMPAAIAGVAIPAGLVCLFIMMLSIGSIGSKSTNSSYLRCMENPYTTYAQCERLR